MPAECVLDASVVARWWLEDVRTETTAAASEFLRALEVGEFQIHVPDLVFPAVSNAFWKATKFAGWSPDEARNATRDLVALGLTTHPTIGLAESAMELGITYEISVYDATYIALGQHLEIPVYSADSKLLRKLDGRLALVRNLD
ncbi:MAG: type II toxin-antitoxin system VapC family toxin [Myxococcota bacterium]